MLYVEFNSYNQKAIFSIHWFYKCNRHNFAIKAPAENEFAFNIRRHFLSISVLSNFNIAVVRWPEPMHHFILQ